MKKRIIIVLEFTEGKPLKEGEEAPTIVVEDHRLGVKITRTGKNGGEEHLFTWPDTRIKYTNR